MRRGRLATSTYCSLSIYRRSEISSAGGGEKEQNHTGKATVLSLDKDITQATVSQKRDGTVSSLWLQTEQTGIVWFLKWGVFCRLKE